VVLAARTEPGLIVYVNRDGLGHGLDEGERHELAGSAGTPVGAENSSGGDLVLVDEPAKHVLPGDPRWILTDSTELPSRCWWLHAERPVWPRTVVVLGVGT
jgi:hypothetical protein